MNSIQTQQLMEQKLSEIFRNEEPLEDIFNILEDIKNSQDETFAKEKSTPLLYMAVLNRPALLPDIMQCIYSTLADNKREKLIGCEWYENTFLMAAFSQASFEDMKYAVQAFQKIDSEVTRVVLLEGVQQNLEKFKQNAAWYYLLAGDHRTALALFKKENSTDPDIIHLILQLSLLLGDKDSAEFEYDRLKYYAPPRFHQHVFTQLTQLLAQQKNFGMAFDAFYKKILSPMLSKMNASQHLTASQNYLVGMLILNNETDAALHDNAYRFLVCADEDTQRHAFYELTKQFGDPVLLDLPEGKLELPVLTEDILEHVNNPQVFYQKWKENSEKQYKEAFKTFGFDPSRRYTDHQIEEAYQDIYSKNQGNQLILDGLDRAYQQIKLAAQRNKVKPVESLEYIEPHNYLPAYTKIIQAEIDRLNHVWVYGGREKATKLSTALDKLHQEKLTSENFQEHDQHIKGILSQHRLSFWDTTQRTRSAKTVAVKEALLRCAPIV